MLTLWTCQRSSLYGRLAGTAGVEPAFRPGWSRAAYPLADPYANENRPLGLPCGRFPVMAFRSYPGTFPMLRAGCEHGSLCP
jgi:hypothetical protein